MAFLRQLRLKHGRQAASCKPTALQFRSSRVICLNGGSQQDKGRVLFSGFLKWIYGLELSRTVQPGFSRPQKSLQSGLGDPLNESAEQTPSISVPHSFLLV